MESLVRYVCNHTIYAAIQTLMASDRCSTSGAKQLEVEFRQLSEEERQPFLMYDDRCPDPTLGVYPPNGYLHSMSENLRHYVEDYKIKNPDNVCPSWICGL